MTLISEIAKPQLHLQDFLLAWLGPHGYSTNLDFHLGITDNEVLSEIRKAANDSDHPGHDPARRIVERDHFRVLYQRNPDDLQKNPDACRAVFDALRERFGPDRVRIDSWKEKGESLGFPVETKDGRILPSLDMSAVLKHLPLSAVDFVFVSKDILAEAREWLSQRRAEIIKKVEEDET